ncbi:redox-regulated ATPase YchF [Enterobacteriaceae endosymbiont of Donacia bicoloricornis]|uniref:redox-regulated ATPase YchF n=1 Tax=Enterobacteriaceae endosymbiont of Donacia bicoloricornis TaxID=2675772 RepID=UPI00144A0E16|nr:redox-regulated ATPase YchF [Enterobacteriaceae endosymbiont of Donacia bicoloricornis]QJC37633.1 redox-regulated ATPase YchF [Enterobacteriaceae endosymbiont of Donacia bicoloricornis]
MELKCGIIGLPNVGKSTLFNVLTNSNVDALNYPFCTIKPNTSIVTVPDDRLCYLSKIIKSKKIIYSVVTFVDIAGLIKGASKGEGLGNQFLHNISEVDAIIHVVRCFSNKNILSLSFNPIKDVNIINNEIINFDINLLYKLKNNKLFFKKWEYLLNKCLNFLKTGKLLNLLKLDKKEINFLKKLKLLTIKPIIIIANTDEKKINNNFFLNEINILNKSYLTLKICIKNLNKKQKILPINKNNDLKNIIICSFKLLNLHTFYTVGIKEIKSWSILKGTTAFIAAKKIHSDIQKGFIRAQIIHYKDFIFYKSPIKAKLFGKMRIEGKQYIIQDGDIVNFLFKI